MCVCVCVCVCVQGSQARALTFTLHHLRTGVPSRGHLHIFERQIEKKEKGGNAEGGIGGRGGGVEERKKRDRWREKRGMEGVRKSKGGWEKRGRKTKPEDYIPPI